MRDDKDRSLGREMRDDRVERFIRRVVESPVDRACQSLSMAGDDVNAAIHQASSQRELGQMKDVIMETIARLETSWRVAMHLDEFWNDKGRS